jgi:hypothetical protein
MEEPLIGKGRSKKEAKQNAAACGLQKSYMLQPFTGGVLMSNSKSSVTTAGTFLNHILNMNINAVDLWVINSKQSNN